MLRVGLIQLISGDDPGENLKTSEALVRRAVEQGARFVLTPEVTNCLSASRTHQDAVLVAEDEDATLARLRALSEELGIWLLIGSLALKDPVSGKFANRSFLIGPDGCVVARYDKIHMFDVDVSQTETYRESDGYAAGRAAVLAQGPGTMVGLSICYDVRFPHLYRSLAKAGAEILMVPAAFSFETGPAHWETLLRARAIETGCFVLAPAQTGHHAARRGRRRRTHGHSLIIDPWGAVIADGGTEQGVVMADLELDEVASARRRIPSLSHDRSFKSP